MDVSLFLPLARGVRVAVGRRKTLAVTSPDNLEHLRRYLREEQRELALAAQEKP